MDLLNRADETDARRQCRESLLTASVLLTGFSRFDLVGTDLVDAYLDFLTAAVGPDVLVELGRRVAALPPDAAARDREVRATILGDAKFGPVARNLIKLWYLGSWAGMPDEWVRQFGPPATVATGVVSTQAYIEGLAWVAVKAHPVGAKPQGFGAWGLPPEPEDDDPAAGADLAPGSGGH